MGAVKQAVIGWHNYRDDALALALRIQEDANLILRTGTQLDVGSLDGVRDLIAISRHLIRIAETGDVP